MQPSNTAEIIPNRLYWISNRMPPPAKENLFYFCTDSQYIYHPYSSDFGPLDLGKIFRYITELNLILSNPKLENSVIYHYTSIQPSKRANSALLMGIFQILILKRTADEACSTFENVDAFVPYLDASSQPSSFELYLEDCLKAFERASKLGWFNMDTFDLKSYEKYSRVDQGGLNWIVPEKLLAFICPATERSSKYPALTPELYSPVLKNLGVSDVVRLNNRTYDAERFERFGIQHFDLYFLDGSVPSESIVNRFIEISERASGAVAVHCKAGLGRTATLIGCYCIKHYGFTGLEAIAWARLCRPGSVLGPQQQFLCEQYEMISGISGRVISDTEKHKAKFGDYGQSARLLSKSNSTEKSVGKFAPKSGVACTVRIASMKNLQFRKK